MKQVCIILLNWQGWRDTIECLDSLAELDYSNYRILVVDNHSTNDSLIKIKAAYPDIELIVNERNLGFGGGCNVGIHKALNSGADYVWLLNNDTHVDPLALRALIEKAESEPKAGAVGSKIYYMDQPNQLQAWGGGYINFVLGVSRHYHKPVPDKCLHYLTGASMLLRREALEQSGSFDEGFFMYWEDADLGFRLRKAGWKLAVAEKSCIWHKESASLGKKSAQLDKYFNNSAVRFFSKHAFLPVIPIMVGVCVRTLKRLAIGDWRRAYCVLRGACGR